MQHCSALVKIASDSYEAWFNLGLAYQKTGRMDQAGNAYREAAKLRPEAPEANAHLGVLLEERGDLHGARHACEAALAAAPDSPGLLWNLALLDEREGRADEAERHFAKLVGSETGLGKTPRSAWVSSRSSGAISPPPWTASNSASSSARDWVEALVNLGLACWKFQDLDSATQTFEKILSLQPQNTDALRALTAIAIERKDHNRAWDLHQKLTGARTTLARVVLQPGPPAPDRWRSGQSCPVLSVGVGNAARFPGGSHQPGPRPQGVRQG